MDTNCLLINADRVVGEEVFEIDVNNSVHLPEAEDISEITAEIKEVKGEVLGDDQVRISGEIHKQIYYVGEDDKIYHRMEEVPFNDVVTLPGADPEMDMDVHVNARVLNVAYTLDDEELSQTVELEAFVKLTVHEQLPVVICPTGPLLKVGRVVTEQCTPTVVSGETTLDREAIKIVRVDARLEDVTYEVADDQVAVEGIIHEDIYYVGRNNIQYRQVDSMPFNVVVPVPGAEPEMDVDVEPSIDRVNYQLEPPLPSDTVETRVMMQVCVSVTEPTQVNVRQSPTGPLIKAEHVVGENMKQYMTENVIRLHTPAVKVQDIHATLRDVTCEVIQNKAVLQGFIHKQVFYVDCNHVIRHIPEDVHFSTFVDVPGAMPGMNCQVHSRIEYLKPELMHDHRGHYCEEVLEAMDEDEEEHGRRPEHDHDDDDDEMHAYRYLLQKIIIEFFVKVTETIQLRVCLCEED